MKRIFALGLSFALVCILNTYSHAQEATQYDAKTPPEGFYFTRWWDLGDSPLGTPLGEDITTFTKTGADIYEVVWTRYNISVIAFYSSGIGAFSGGYYDEDRERWGGFFFRWDGVTVNGRWIPFGEKATGYTIFYPLNSTYTLTSALTLISEDSGN